MVLKKRGKVIAIAAAAAAAFAAGSVAEHFEGATFVEETAATDGDFPVYTPASDHVVNGKININSATEEELASLEGIGEALAERITDYRGEHGDFSQEEGLMLVPGIGEKLYENIKDEITVGTEG